MSSKDNLTPAELMKSVLQRIATGPELSKNITREEAKAAMSAILNEEISDVRSAIFLIALIRNSNFNTILVGLTYLAPLAPQRLVPNARVVKGRNDSICEISFAPYSFR